MSVRVSVGFHLGFLRVSFRVLLRVSFEYGLSSAFYRVPFLVSLCFFRVSCRVLFKVSCFFVSLRVSLCFLSIPFQVSFWASFGFHLGFLSGVVHLGFL